MSQESLAKVLERASADAAFRSQLQSNLEGALARYDLTAEEGAALLSGGSAQMQSLGVDPRMTKYDTTSGTPWASGD